MVPLGLSPGWLLVLVIVVLVLGSGLVMRWRDQRPTPPDQVLVDKQVGAQNTVFQPAC